MIKKILIGEINYQPSSIINKQILEKGGFTEQLECSSGQYICLSNGTSKLILEILGNKDSSEDFKIFDID